jgi:flagellar basal body-associated protein FliL
VLGERSYGDLAAPGGRSEAKEELAHHIAELYHEEVVDVYFTEFVMQ